MTDWTVLDEWQVIHTRERAVLAKKGDTKTWIPRSVLLDGEDVAQGDTDLAVKSWFAEAEGLE